MNDALVTYSHVDVKQGDRLLLHDVNLNLRPGSFVYLTGRVGAGKTSLLKTMYAELDIDSGEAMVLGHDMRRMKPAQVARLRRRMGIVFQDFQLLTDRTVGANLEFVLRATGWRDKTEMAQRIQAVLGLVGMEERGGSMPHELSGGEQQRVVIARAVLNSPDMVLADEPTGNLDAETGCEITCLLHHISLTGTLVVMTTHNRQLISQFPGVEYRCAGGRVEQVAT